MVLYFLCLVLARVFQPVLQLATASLSREKQRAEKSLFDDQVFALSPLSGDLWPNGEIEVTVSFMPDRADDFLRTAYLDVTGREERMPLQLKV